MSVPLGGGGLAAGIGSNTAPHLAYHDLRKWLEEAQKLGEVKEVNGLSWQGDIGMVSEMALHDDNAPCFVFGDVPGTIKGSRVLVNFFGGKRKNMTLGFPTGLSKLELSEASPPVSWGRCRAPPRTTATAVRSSRTRRPAPPTA